MRKFKLFIPAVITALTSVAPVAILTNCSAKSNVLLAQEVKDKGVSIKSFNIVVQQESTIELDLPSNTTIADINLSVDTSALTKSDVAISGNKIIIPANKVISNYITITNIVLRTTPTPTSKTNILTCSWTELDTWCQKLEKSEIDEAQFCDHFAIGNSSISSLNDLIGVERTIKINDVDYLVRIASTQTDTISMSGELNKLKAILTFELEGVVCDNDGNTLPSIWDSTGYCIHYHDSTLRANLTGSGNGTKTWDKPAIDMLSNELVEVIKPTIHYITYSQDTSCQQWMQKSYIDKLFAPSYQNLTSKYSFYCLETKNIIFKYYANAESASKELDARIKCDKNNKAVSYWLTTAYPPYPHSAWCTNELGNLLEGSVNDTNGKGVTFAFSI